jgi:septum site-determining protein MinC
VTIAVRPNTSLRFRGRTFLALVLAPEMPFKNWLNELDAALARSPGFFAGRAVIVDISGAQQVSKREIAALVADLHERGIRIMALEGADPSMSGLGLPPMISGGKPAGMIEVPGLSDAEPEVEAEDKESADSAPTSQAAGSLLIEGSVRSGQSIVHMDGDVTVLGSVASGAEVIAGGSVHVYGTLRGRAIAGAAGNTRARIFCRRLEAELLSIDGLYKTAEDLGSQFRSQAVQVSLDGDSMIMKALD